jgi:hypothetical protein
MGLTLPDNPFAHLDATFESDYFDRLTSDSFVQAGLCTLSLLIDFAQYPLDICRRRHCTVFDLFDVCLCRFAKVSIDIVDIRDGDRIECSE